MGIIQAFVDVNPFLTTAGECEMEVCPREYLSLERYFILDIENWFGFFEFFFKGTNFHSLYCHSNTVTLHLWH